MNFLSNYFYFFCLGVLLLVVGCSGEESTSASKEGVSSFPEKPVTLIVPSAAGGGTDATARALADATEDHLGESIGVENKEGGSGAIGMTQGANATPDGYTVSMVFVELTMLNHLGMSELTSDQFKPLGLVNLDPAALTVSADAPYDTVEEFIKYAEEHPGEVKVGNAGTGSIWHIAAESLAKETGIKLNHVPFEGAAPAVTSLMGGHVDAVTVSPAEVLPQVEAGDLKTLGVMSKDRSNIMEDVPTFEEEGVDVTPVGTWRGLVVPKDTPDEVAGKLEDAFLKGAEEEEFTEFMKNNGLGLEIKSSDEFQQFMNKESEFYGEIISDLDLGSNE
ncbi:Tripartite-type tricarboxylate transporter, receptor component TctC [Halobacillus karajensis]|uniref:tripartite tricarboxylate transporter substrate binding protein n=1 Tax=Halobacillus karajensis TaxID=195088 RepID=UPI0008A78C34|nr:tripartite tricarboxylate transporter substrate binding protein [Halobacillus karajensis]SEH41869.1 Tripartite-type tricarboxylate transporter, receptor component TctC [Halobacillus karajensis]